VQDLERDGLDIAIRHGPASLAGANAVRLFGERVFPVCSPRLLKKLPLREPTDLKAHCLLQYSDPEGRHPWLNWKTWLEVAGIADLRPAGTLSFSGYDQIIPAAVAGHGVALGRMPLLKDLLAAKDLVAPFKNFAADPSRAYFAIVAKNATGRAEATDFVEWLREEAKV
jgi:LysR family transcriptional regulator, glycine cleavage system transcriptional activator